jgi:predicted ATPase
MLTSLQIQNFKAWKDTGKFRLAPLTVIFGANSAGKSSLGHLLLALKQTTLSVDRRRAIHLGDSNSLIDLGTFKECIYDHDLSQPLSFHLAWKLPQGLKVEDPLQETRYKGDQLELNVTLLADKNDQPEVTELCFLLKEKKNDVLDVIYSRKDDGQFDLQSNAYKFVRTVGRSWPLDKPEKFYRMSEQSRARFQNAGFLSDFALAAEQMLDHFYYLGPLREHPKRIYPWSGETPDHVGIKGEYTIAAFLAAQNQGRQLNRGRKCKQQHFAEFIAGWLKDLGIIHSFSVKPVAEGRKEYEVLVKTHSSASEVKITDVGFGVSQVLPVLVDAFYCPPGSVVWMEQPEIHLHPQVQAELADVFISAIKSRENGNDRNVQLIIESHSEHFLNRLQRRVAEGTLSPEEVAIYFCKRNGKAAELEPLRLNLLGDIENWPPNFFGDEMADLTARTVAAAATKRREEEQAK